MRLSAYEAITEPLSRFQAVAPLGTGADFLLRYRPPLLDSRFWATQLLVLAIAGVHDSVEAFGLLPEFGALYFVPISLFFVPVVYAALNFGLSGSVATALWCTAITVPNWVVWHSGSERLGVMFQMGIVDAIAVFVGHRVDEQMKARSDAEAASRALQISETKYRGLFETAGEGVLVLDKGGRIAECNAAAGALLGKTARTLRNSLVTEALPPDVASTLCTAVQSPDSTLNDVLLHGPDGKEVWVEPVCTPLGDEGGLTQVLLRNVTEQKRRQAGLETYAAQIVKAQEEERRRMAQELHDETVQSLILLCRRLDAVEGHGVGVPPSFAEDVRGTRSLAESIAESLRGLIGGLRPPLLDDLGLTPAVRRLVTDLSSRSPVEANLVTRGRGRRLPEETELALFRIAQEALHNVERHSDASHVMVRLNHRRDKTELVVSDDGKGFLVPVVLNDLAKENKLGLMGMQERARIVGGNLWIRSDPGEGTVIVAQFPIPDIPH